MKKVLKKVFLPLVLCGAALGGCNDRAPEELDSHRVTLPEMPGKGPAREQLGKARMYETVGNSRVPVDTTPQDSTTTPSTDSRLVKAPALRRATRDEIEDYNGTFRTEGSRDRLLGRIKAAPNERARRELVDVFERVTQNLSPEAKHRASTKLAATLRAASVIQQANEPAAVRAEESVVGR